MAAFNGGSAAAAHKAIGTKLLHFVSGIQRGIKLDTHTKEDRSSKD